MVKTPKTRRGPRKRAYGTRYIRYGEKLTLEICRRLARGEAWRNIAGRGEMPSHFSLYRWREKYPEFAAMLRLAREAQADTWAEAALDVADDATSESLSKDKVRVSTLLRLAGRGTPARAAARDGEPRTVLVSIREFVPVTLADGRVVTREIRPDGSVIDYDR